MTSEMAFIETPPGPAALADRPETLIVARRSKPVSKRTGWQVSETEVMKQAESSDRMSERGSRNKTKNFRRGFSLCT